MQMGREGGGAERGALRGDALKGWAGMGGARGSVRAQLAGKRDVGSNTRSTAGAPLGHAKGGLGVVLRPGGCCACAPAPAGVDGR